MFWTEELDSVFYSPVIRVDSAATATAASRESTLPLSSERIGVDRLRLRIRTAVLGRFGSEIPASELGWETLMRAALELAMNR